LLPVLSMKTAIMILTFNRVDYTRDTIRHYEHQLGSRKDFHFYIYENGSSDGTAEYFRNYSGPLHLDVTYGPENIGISNGTKILLQEKCFDQGYELIIRADDDEMMPGRWFEILSHYDEIERQGLPFIGFKRKGLKNYFEGFGWVSKLSKNPKVMTFGIFDCYRALVAPGMQIASEIWWKRMLPYFSDFGFLYGGWDQTLMIGLSEYQKHFALVFNQESLHFQIAGDYEELAKFKQENSKKCYDIIVSDNLVKLSINYIQSRKYDEAIYILEKTKKKFPENGESESILWKLHLLKNYPSRAMAASVQKSVTHYLTSISPIKSRLAVSAS